MCNFKENNKLKKKYNGILIIDMINILIDIESNYYDYLLSILIKYV